ncbi:MAG: Tox-REase-5 domain-containing protein [Pseudonocardiaceae bacterium]
MPAGSRAYQTFITGAPAGWNYIAGTVSFDGYGYGVLQEVKHAYAQFVEGGRFADWWTGTEELVSQARRQLEAGGSYLVRWYFNEQIAADAFRVLLQERGISGIAVVVVPWG